MFGLGDAVDVGVGGDAGGRFTSRSHTLGGWTLLPRGWLQLATEGCAAPWGYRTSTRSRWRQLKVVGVFAGVVFVVIADAAAVVVVIDVVDVTKNWVDLCTKRMKTIFFSEICLVHTVPNTIV